MIPFPAEPFSGLDPAIGSKLHGLVSYSLSSLHKQGYGVMVSNDLADLKSFDEENPERRSPHTAFDAEYHPNEIAAQGLFLMKNQERVGTVWRRIVPLRNLRGLTTLSLEQCFSGLHIFYEDPGLALRRETCEVDCTLAKRIIGGSVCFGGAGYHQPEHRHQGLFGTMATLSLVLSITAHEQWDWFIATVEEKNRELAIALFPYKNYTRDLIHTREKRREFWLCTASYEEAVALALKAAF